MPLHVLQYIVFVVNFQKKKTTLKVEITSKSSNTVVHKSEQRVHKIEQSNESLTKFYTKHNVSFLF